MKIGSHVKLAQNCSFYIQFSDIPNTSIMKFPCLHNFNNPIFSLAFRSVKSPCPYVKTTYIRLMQTCQHEVASTHNGELIICIT